MLAGAALAFGFLTKFLDSPSRRRCSACSWRAASGAGCSWRRPAAGCSPWPSCSSRSTTPGARSGASPSACTSTRAVGDSGINVAGGAGAPLAPRRAGGGGSRGRLAATSAPGGHRGALVPRRGGGDGRDPPAVATPRRGHLTVVRAALRGRGVGGFAWLRGAVPRDFRVVGGALAAGLCVAAGLFLWSGLRGL